MDDVYAMVGRSLRHHRRAAGLTLEGLSELSGLGPAYIGQIERSAKKPSLRTLAKLAEALDVPVAALVDGKNGQPKARPSTARELELTLRALAPKRRAFLVSVVRHLARELRSLH